MGAIKLYRWSRALHLKKVPLLPGLLRRAILHLYGAWLPCEAKIGEGTMLGYGGLGVVLHKDAVIGRHCLLSQQVTLGGRNGQPGAPVLGDFVRVGAGARILGNIRVEDFAVIGANAVVVHDVPRGAVVAGVPARVLREQLDPVFDWTRDMGRPPPGIGMDGRNVIAPKQGEGLIDAGAADR